MNKEDRESVKKALEREHVRKALEDYLRNNPQITFKARKDLVVELDRSHEEGKPYYLRIYWDYSEYKSEEKKPRGKTPGYSTFKEIEGVWDFTIDLPADLKPADFLVETLYPIVSKWLVYLTDVEKLLERLTR